MTSPPPPSYGKQDYWESRFKDNKTSYDWLEHATKLDAEIAEALALSKTDRPKILHIGCGTSMLSIHLRAFVNDPTQIQHIDFSAEAIEWGRNLEKETFCFVLDDEDDDDDDEDEEGEVGKAAEFPEGFGKAEEQLRNEVPMMKWTQTSLLDLQSVISTCELGGYQVIVDKSCCDAIACASWVQIPMPFFLCTEDADPSVSPSGSDFTTEDEYSIYPINLLAIHLALVAKPAARWIALSYSKDRWPFCPDESMLESTAADQALPKGLLDSGFPDPAKLWSLIKKESIMVKTTGENVEHSGHWIYVFERTDLEIKVQGT
jgi:hypothetical protein